MTTKHTPGPWFAEAGGGRWCVWDDEGIACICDVHAGVEPDPSGATHAHLIAAAPDLLAALEAAHGYLVMMGTDHADHIRSVCRAAIAKAKGEK